MTGTTQPTNRGAPLPSGGTPPAAVPPSGPSAADSGGEHGWDLVDTVEEWVGRYQVVYDATWGRVSKVLSAVGRHSINNLGGLGIPGHAWNVRDAYRTSYDDDKRLGAAVGDALTVGVAALMLRAWHARQFATPAVWNLPRPLVVSAGLALLGVAATSGIANSVHDAQDDGDLRGLGTAAGIVGAVLVSRMVPGTWPSRITLVAGGAAAAVAGYHLGRRVEVGPGHLGEDVPEASRLEHAPPLAAARGAWTHFVEAGPLSQGTGFGKSWGQVADMRRRYTDAELAGGMTGDVLAGTIVGTTALVATGRVLGRAQTSRLTQSPLARLGMELSIPARVVNKLRDTGALVNIVPGSAEAELAAIAARTGEHVGASRTERWWGQISGMALEYDGAVPQLLYLAGAGLFVWTLLDAYNAGENSKNGRVDGGASAAITGVGILGGAALVAKYAPGVRELPRAVKPGVALIAASACAAAISLLREPVGSFIDGAVELNQRRGATIDPLSVGVTATGALAGAVVGARAAKLMSFGGPIRLGLIGAGLAIGGGVGWSFAPLVSPDHASTGPTLAAEPEPTGPSEDQDSEG